MNWDEYFLGIARAVSLRSKDPRTKVGCVIINSDKHIIATGYNGCPPGFPETPEMWNSEEKHLYVIHAEMNALLHATTSVAGAHLYTTHHPCPDCVKAICTAGISKVYFRSVKFRTETSVKILRAASVMSEQLLGDSE